MAIRDNEFSVTRPGGANSLLTLESSPQGSRADLVAKIENVGVFVGRRLGRTNGAIEMLRLSKAAVLSRSVRRGDHGALTNVNAQMMMIGLMYRVPFMQTTAIQQCNWYNQATQILSYNSMHVYAIHYLR